VTDISVFERTVMVPVAYPRFSLMTMDKSDISSLQIYQQFPSTRSPWHH